MHRVSHEHCGQTHMTLLPAKRAKRHATGNDGYPDDILTFSRVTDVHAIHDSRTLVVSVCYVSHYVGCARVTKTSDCLELSVSHMQNSKPLANKKGTYCEITSKAFYK